MFVSKKIFVVGGKILQKMGIHSIIQIENIDSIPYDQVKGKPVLS